MASRERKLFCDEGYVRQREGTEESRDLVRLNKTLPLHFLLTGSAPLFFGSTDPAQ